MNLAGSRRDLAWRWPCCCCFVVVVVGFFFWGGGQSIYQNVLKNFIIFIKNIKNMFFYIFFYNIDHFMIYMYDWWYFLLNFFSSNAV